MVNVGNIINEQMRECENARVRKRQEIINAQMRECENSKMVGDSKFEIVEEDKCDSAIAMPSAMMDDGTTGTQDYDERTTINDLRDAYMPSQCLRQ